jgi:hypothetical protein
MERPDRGASVTAERSLPVELLTCTSSICTLSAFPISPVTLIPSRAAGAVPSYWIRGPRMRRFLVPSNFSG